MGPILIKAGRVFDGIADGALDHACVLVDGETITAVGPQSAFEGSTGSVAKEIDLGPEVTVLPGLINMHTHMSFSSGPDIFADHQAESAETKLIRSVENLQTALRTGVTTLRDCGTLNRIAFAVRDAVERGTLQGPRIIASGSGLTTTGGHLWFCGVEADGEVAVRRAVRTQIKAGADFIKAFATGGNSTPGTNALAAQYSEAEMCAIAEEARRLGKRVAVHAHGAPGVHHAVAARVTSIEHCSFMRSSGIEYEPDQARRIVDAGLYVCPTVFRGRRKILDLTQAPLSPGDAGFLARQEARFRLVRRLVEDGVQIISGNDAGVPFTTFDDYPGDLFFTAEGTGLSPIYLLKTATSVAAQALGRHDLGVLAPGKAADLLAVHGNPLQDLCALAAPRLVVARGRVVSDDRR